MTVRNKTVAELEYIVKDAGEAARAMQGMDSRAEGKYLDQVNDAQTELYRRRHGKGESKGFTGDQLTLSEVIKHLRATAERQRSEAIAPESYRYWQGWTTILYTVAQDFAVRAEIDEADFLAVCGIDH